MKPSEYDTMFAVEERHWWYVGMQRITMVLMEELYPAQRDLHILDAGCGTGAAMRYLGRFGQVTGCDFSALALSYCQQRGLTRLSEASVMCLPFAANSFDLVTSFDVLYHRAVEVELVALRDFWRVLKPGGRVLLRLPAYNWLRSHHDEVIHTGRRFSARGVGSMLSASQFTVEKLSYANTILFPLAVVKRLAERILPREGEHSDVHENPDWQDDWLARLLGAEAGWLRKHNLPFGLSVVAVGRKEQ
jgi:ubiquinone/menaquinone biosynthesis C-methylase UbiE